MDDDEGKLKKRERERNKETTTLKPANVAQNQLKLLLPEPDKPSDQTIKAMGHTICTCEVPVQMQASNQHCHQAASLSIQIVSLCSACGSFLALQSIFCLLKPLPFSFRNYTKGFSLLSSSRLNPLCTLLSAPIQPILAGKHIPVPIRLAQLFSYVNSNSI